MDLFRHTERYCSTFTVDDGFSGEAHHVSLSRTVLNELISEAMGDRLLAELSLTQPPALTVRSIPRHVTASIGAASVVPSSDMTPEDLLKRADDALYQTKDAGRNRAVLYRAVDGLI